MHSRARVALVLIAFALAVVPPTTLGGSVDPSLLADAARYRAELGFDSSPEVVGPLVLASAGTAFGLPLTTGEERELIRRSELRERLEPALELVGRHPQEFGGLYFDQSVGDLLLVVMTLPTTTPPVFDALKGLLPPDASVAIRVAEYSLAELESLRNNLVYLLPEAIASL